MYAERKTSKRIDDKFYKHRNHCILLEISVTAVAIILRLSFSALLTFSLSFLFFPSLHVIIIARRWEVAHQMQDIDRNSNCIVE